MIIDLESVCSYYVCKNKSEPSYIDITAEEQVKEQEGQTPVTTLN